MDERCKDNAVQYAAAEGGMDVRMDMDARCDAMVYDLARMTMPEDGRLLFINIRIGNVRPGRQVALGIILYEDEDGEKRARGLRTLVIPPVEGESARDVLVREIGFVLPEARSGAHALSARVVAHYMNPDMAAACPAGQA